MTTTAANTPTISDTEQRSTAVVADRRAVMWMGSCGLRGRAALAFAVVALLLSTAVGGTVWVSVSGYLLSKRQQAATSQTLANVERVRRGLSSQGVSSPQLLAQLPREIGSTSLLLIGGRWSTTSLETDRGILPAELRSAVIAGEPMSQRIRTDDGPKLVVGFPLTRMGNAYFEVFPLDELDQTLRTLSTTLVLAVVTVPAGSLLLGWWALRPALRPLDRVASAATAIAAGDLSARLDPRGDPGLASIAASFNNTAAALERRVRADAKFAADVSHELRGPLTVMLTAVDLVEHHISSLPPDGREALGLLRAEVTRFERLVDDLLEISRADAGSSDLVLEAAVLPDLVKQSVPPQLQDRVVLTSTANVVVHVDKRRLERVVMNLVNNAQQHGCGLTAVTVSSDDGWAHIAVEDRGPGVDRVERERIFERFDRGRRGGSDTDGAGLGLSLVARHVHLMGGTVAVEDVCAGGSRFIVSLPELKEPLWLE